MGRKSVTDKERKIQVCVYIPQYLIDKFGNVENLKDKIYEFVKEYDKKGN